MQFTDVQPLVLLEHDPSPPSPVTQLLVSENENNYGYKKDAQWLDNVKELIKKEKLESNDNISWAAYHASKEQQLIYNIVKMVNLWRAWRFYGNGFNRRTENSICTFHLH